MAGVRVLDLSHAIAGAIPGTVLADLGADVLKVESTAHVDMVRWPSDSPRYARKVADPWALQLLRGKRSVQLNFKTTTGRTLLLELAAHCDVVVENFSAGTLERAGITYDVLREARSDIILLSLRGHTSPRYASFRHGAPGLQAFSGIDSAISYDDGRSVVVGRPVGDVLAGFYGLVAVLAALMRRRRSGVGAHLQGGLDTALAGAFGALYLGGVEGWPVATDAIRRPGAVPSGYFPCLGEDRWVAISVTGEQQWSAFTEAIGATEWQDDPAFGDAFRRTRRRPEIDKRTAAWTSSRTAEAACEELADRGVPAMPLLTPQIRRGHEHLTQRGVFLELAHPGLDAPPLATVRWDGGTAAPHPRDVLPDLGAHTSDVLTALAGRTPEQIAQLRDDGVLS